MTEKYFTVRFVLEFIIPLCIIAVVLAGYLLIKFYKSLCNWRYKRIEKQAENIKDCEVEKHE